MTLSDPRRITDELLSAYIDDEVTDQERAIVEAAIATDKEVAWRLNSLRQTVTLLHDLPELALPRSFALTLDQVRVAQGEESLAMAGAAAREPVDAPRQAAPASQREGGFWADLAEGWRNFWQGGNPMLRNAAAVSFVLMLVVAGGGQLIDRAISQPFGSVATAPEAVPAAAPASESAASAAAESTTASSAESVALAPPTVASAAEPTVAKTGETESLQAQAEPTVEAPDTANARIMQAPASDTTTSDAAASDESQSAEAAGAAASESAVAEEDAAAAEAAIAAAPAAEADVQESADGEAPVEEQAAAAAMAPAEETPVEEAQAAAAMAAPAASMPVTGNEEPPLVAQPGPGMGPGGAGGRPESGGGGMGGGGPAGDLPPGSEGALVPQQAYGFDVNPAGDLTPLPAEEASDAAEESVADVAVTPAVEVAEATESDTAREAEPTATPEAVALIAPEGITSSEVVENVPVDTAVAPTDEGANLPVVWIAQGAMLLLTILFASLWWRSRKEQ